jgi:peptide/nickel transport system permease protein
MLRLLAGRLLQAAAASFGVLTIVFFVMRLSGDPTLLLVPEGASAEQVAQLRTALGFDRPLAVQYAAYLGDLLRLDLGESLVQRAPVAAIVGDRIPYTLAPPASSWPSTAAACWNAPWPPWSWPARACPPSGPASS